MPTTIYDALGMLVFGAIITDLVSHPNGFSRIAFALDGRCHVCGYKYNHPIVRHLGVRGVECGWR